METDPFAHREPGVSVELHQLTSHRPHVAWPDEPRMVKGFQPMRFDRKPPQFKTYRDDLHAEVLPQDLAPGPPGISDLATLGRILFLSAGVVRYLDTPTGRLWFRAAGSAGNLSPVEVYVVTGGLPDLAAGVYHYDPVMHMLERLRDAPVDTPPSLVLTGVPWRTTWKYRERGFRHLWWDAGTMLGQALAVAEDAGFRPRVELAFVDAEVAALVGAEPPHELPLAVVGLEGESVLPSPGRATLPRGFLADDPFEFPLVSAAYRSGELVSAPEARAWRERAAAFDGRRVPAGDGFHFADGIDLVVRRRGSTRRFDSSRSAPARLIHEGLAWAAAPVYGDFVAPGATLLQHDVIVHAADGVEPGAYRLNPGGLELLRAGDLRANARHLTLDQNLGGDGAFTVFHSADLGQVTSGLGERGYRAALLEAGITEGRLHLAAYAVGQGATGLTFYDDDVSRFFATTASPMLVTAVGAPGYRSRPGGIPRDPVRMVPE